MSDLSLPTKCIINIICENILYGSTWNVILIMRILVQAVIKITIIFSERSQEDLHSSGMLIQRQTHTSTKLSFCNGKLCN